jgi:hypothetical protein
MFPTFLNSKSTLWFEDIHKRYNFRAHYNFNLDSSISDIKRIYGNPNNEFQMHYAPIPYTTLSYGGFNFTFILSSGKIANIQVFK